MLVYRKSLVGSKLISHVKGFFCFKAAEHFSYVNAFFCRNNVSENSLYVYVANESTPCCYQ